MVKNAELDSDLLALRSLSSLQPLYSLERSVAAVDRMGAAGSAEFLDSLRMRTLVARRLSSVATPSPAVRACLEALSAKVADLRGMHAALEANLDRLARIGRDAGLELFAGKGVAAHSMYTDRSVRDFNDVDIFVRTRAEATTLATTLRGEFGYRYQVRELPWFKLDPADGLVYGQIALVAPSGSPDLLNVDIHFGDYSVRHCSRLSITETLPAGPPGLHLMAPEENLACIVNNAAGDYFVTAKDTNDLLMALSLPAFDMARFAAQVDRAHLGGFLGHIVRALRASSVLSADQERMVRALPVARTLEPAPRPDRADWNRRCLGTTVHAFTARRHEGVVSAVGVAANAFAYYRKRLALRTAPDGARPIDPIEFTPWTCIRLVPVDIAVGVLGEVQGAAEAAPAGVGSPVGTDRGIARFDLDSGTYFQVEDEIFVATVDYTLSPAVVRRAVAASASSR